ncbi:MAG: hypothetical protein V7749_10820 [Cocleimonas sp.]
MNPNNRTASLLFALFVVLLSATASASPRNVNSIAKQTAQLELKAAQLLAQQDLTYAAYVRLLEISEKKEKAKKSRNLKGHLVKASFKSSNNKSNTKYNKRLHVTATAYTSHVAQTDSTPNIAAWGDRLKPGMKVIAVSRDLLNVYGLKHRQKVRIKGLEGEYLVLDKMNKRWRKKIDIYMGMNKKKAFRWGRRKVEILWNS